MKDKPVRSYMICTAPRSGSTMLCGLLAATETAGDPDSHFHNPAFADWLDDYGLNQTDYDSHEDAVRAVFEAALRRGTGGSNIFGLRMQRGSFDHFMQQLECIVPGRMSDVDRIETVFGPTLFIHLSRPDRLGQAISRIRAEQSGLWHRNADGTELERLSPPKKEHYDEAALRHHIAASEGMDAAWETWFEREAIDPLRITYDALAQQPNQILAEILTALDLDPAQAQTVEVPTAKLADETSREWRARFLGQS